MPHVENSMLATRNRVSTRNPDIILLDPLSRIDDGSGVESSGTKVMV
jgi:hypothetical protein